MRRHRHTLNVSLRVAAVMLALATVGAIASTGAEALQGRQLVARRATQAAPGSSRIDSTRERTSQSSSGALADSAPQTAEPPTTAPSPAGPAVSAPVVAEGRTELGDGVFAVRDGKSITVSFDVPHARTRRRDKFDRIVRATLPKIYGPAAQAVLDGIPRGQLVAVGTLPADLEKTGLRIALGHSASIELWPELRDARGGPLVVGYRAEAGQ